MKIEKLMPTLMANPEINKLVASLSSTIQSRNIAPMRLMQMYSGRVLDGDQLTQDYSKLLELIKTIIEQIDFSDLSAIEKIKITWHLILLCGPLKVVMVVAHTLAC